MNIRCSKCVFRHECDKEKEPCNDYVYDILLNYPRCDEND